MRLGYLRAEEPASGGCLRSLSRARVVGTLGCARRACASRLRNADPTFPVCIASGIFVAQRTPALSFTICGCSLDHGGVLSLCSYGYQMMDQTETARARRTGRCSLRTFLGM